MQPFGGSEPLVGEVYALRTFRVEETGLLLPLFAERAWYDGPNVATCAPPAGEPRGPHQIVAAHCKCGFYAYGTTAATAQHTQSRRVLAVVSCWGRLVAGTQGVRAEYARIVAVWLAPSAPTHLRRRVAATYPSAQVYADRDAMLAEHPPTVLPSYSARRHRDPRGVLAAATLAGLFALGVMPDRVIRQALFPIWLSALIALAVGVVQVMVTRTPGRATVTVLATFMAAWLVAPRFDWWWATLLRAPLVLLLVSASISWLLDRRRDRFPVVQPSRSRRPTS